MEALYGIMNILKVPFPNLECIHGLTLRKILDSIKVF